MRFGVCSARVFSGASVASSGGVASDDFVILFGRASLLLAHFRRAKREGTADCQVYSAQKGRA